MGVYYYGIFKGIKVIVCDESHYLKSTLAKRSQTVQTSAVDICERYVLDSADAASGFSSHSVVWNTGFE